jgi:hypothetical protein
MSIGDVLQAIGEGLFYDGVKYILGPLIVTAAGTVILKFVFDKLKSFKEIAIFAGSFFVAAAMFFYVLGSTTPQPRLVGAMQSSITAAAASPTDTVAIIALSVINTGSMQTIIKNWQVEASINGTKYIAAFPQMPDKFEVNLPNLGEDSPLSITYHKEDDLLVKSASPLQPGALVTGTLFVVFQHVDPVVFKDGADITATFQDVLSKQYAATIKTTARFDKIGAVPGMHSELVCRVPPNRVPLASPMTPRPSLPQ